jgi:hypothetical protein
MLDKSMAQTKNENMCIDVKRTGLWAISEGGKRRKSLRLPAGILCEAKFW